MTEEIEIILVEDNKSDADLFLRALKKNNIHKKVLHLKNGQEALDYFFPGSAKNAQKINNLPKIILLDLDMPKVSGLHVLQKLKENDITKNIPVGILTSSKEDPNIEECYRLGAKSYIVKPLNYLDFVKVVAGLSKYLLLDGEIDESI